MAQDGATPSEGRVLGICYLKLNHKHNLLKEKQINVISCVYICSYSTERLLFPYERNTTGEERRNRFQQLYS